MPVGYAPQNLLSDEASQRGMQQDTYAPTGIAWDGVVGGRRVTIYGNTPLSDAEVMDRLRRNSDFVNTRARTGGLTRALDSPEYWQAVHPNATQAERDAQASAYARRQRENADQGEFAPSTPFPTMLGLMALAAGGAALAGWSPFAAGAGAGAGTGAGAAAGTGAATGASTAGATGLGTLAGSGAPATAGGMVTSSGLGAFAPGSSIGSMATSNAGLLAGSGAITGGAGTGAALSRGLNSLAGIGGGEGMGWNWETILDYGIPLVGGLLERDGAKDAARESAAGAAAALAENRRQYDTSRADMMPWLEAGRGALGRLQDPTAFTASPSYNFVRDEGMRGIENTFAARGGAASGNALRRLAEFNAGLASQEHNNWWNQQAGLAGVGQTSAQNLGVLGSNAAANAGGLMQQQANARASGIAGSTNALTNLLGNLSSVWNRRNQQVG